MMLFAPEVKRRASGLFLANDSMCLMRFSSKISSTAIRIPVSSTSPKP